MDKIYTPSSVNRYIKYKFDYDTNLKNISIKGEISNFKNHSRGHYYFTIKDDEAQIQCAMFYQNAKDVTFELKDGQKVVLTGDITTYEVQGTYQIIVSKISLDGIGNLYVAFLKLKAELEKKGYFSVEHKKAIPRFPKKIGVITSDTGAAIKDIINITKRRYPICEIILYPTLVQGINAKDSIVNNIKKANNDKLCDVLIVGRGGGSIEDLWAFNEEVVVKAIFDSNIPIISAVGHEIDYTLSDYVADIRAATPSAAAEIATPDIFVLKKAIFDLESKIKNKVSFYIENIKIKLMSCERLLDSYSPIKILIQKKDNLKNLINILNYKIKNIIDYKRNKFCITDSSLRLLSPLNITNKGYLYVSKDSKMINSVNDVKINDVLKLESIDGEIITRVVEVNKIER